jgi:hypothetical protein
MRFLAVLPLSAGLLCIFRAAAGRDFDFGHPGPKSGTKRPMPSWLARPFFLGMGAFTIWAAFRVWTQ